MHSVINLSFSWFICNIQKEGCCRCYYRKSSLIANLSKYNYILIWNKIVSVEIAQCLGVYPNCTRRRVFYSCKIHDRLLVCWLQSAGNYPKLIQSSTLSRWTRDHRSRPGSYYRCEIIWLLRTFSRCVQPI